MTVIRFEVEDLPPAKSQRSVFGLRSKHYKRTRRLLEEAHRAKSRLGFSTFGNAPLRLDVEVWAPIGMQPGDGTNYLGGIADVLEEKAHREKTSGSLEYLGYRRHVGLYRNDRQLKEIHYRESVGDSIGYSVSLRELE